MMSNPPENRWSNLGNSQPRQNTPSSSSRDRTSNAQQKNQNPTSGQPKPNAWASGKSNTASATASTATTTPSMSALAEERYIPVGGFNGEEVKEHMRKTYQEATTGGTEKTAQYKASEEGSGKAGGPWGQKPSTMANGQDFWVQLKKQVAGLGQDG